MKPILVCTAHHTGTHTLKRLLETSPDVPACIHGDSVDELVDAACGNRLEPTELLDNISSIRESTKFDWDHLVQTVANHYGYTLPKNRSPRCELLRSHSRTANETAFQFFTPVATLRHPVASIITALRKEGHAQRYVLTANALATMKGVHTIAIDRLSGDSARRLFSCLGIRPSEHTEVFATLNPRINATYQDHGTDRWEYAIEHNDCPKEYRDAKDLWEHRGEVHDCVRPWLAKVSPAAMRMMTG